MDIKRLWHFIAIPSLLFLFWFAYQSWSGAIRVHFYAPLWLYLLIAFLPVKWASKQVSGQHSRTKRFLIQYSFAICFALAFHLWSDGFTWDRRSSLVYMIGMIEAAGTFAMWKATEISLAKVSLFSFMDDLIPMMISALVLNELAKISPLTGFGVIICLSVVGYFISSGKKEKRQLELEKRKKDGMSDEHIADLDRLSRSGTFFKYVAMYSIAWGVSMFFARYLSFNQLTPGNFAIGKYSGAFTTALLIFFFYKDSSASQQVGKASLSVRDFVFMLYYSSAIVLCAMLSYAVARTTEQNVYQPLVMIGEAVGGTWIGWKFFGEGRQFNKSERIAVSIGLLGIAVIGLATYLKA